ncbi:MAG: mechanosensitive ion channel [Granulosicoccus sp.]|nr:mechanosensitive ion channel [Granulosicoccus sp.]
MNRTLWLSLLLINLTGVFLPCAQAQETAVPAENSETQLPVDQAAASSAAQTSKLQRLEYIQKILTQKINERSSLGERIEAANEQDQSDLRRQADDLTNDIQQLRTTLESIATGGVDTSLFTIQDTTEESNWREDVALIAQPVIDSLKDLTEKPRRLKELNDTIALRQQEIAVAQEALSNLDPAIALDPQGELGKSLGRLQKLWAGRLSDAQSAIEIARFQIADLQGDKPISQTVFEALGDFVTGRGLTIVLAILVASGVYFGVRFLLRGYRKSLVDSTEAESRTRYRLAAYSVQALTFVLILIAVFVVFYERGDVLLLGLLILLIVGLALGIRHLLPQYLREARLLLNIGAMREGERIHYRDLPWRVESINMYTVLRNPELHGVLRIPLAEFHGVTSRPSGKDTWFPSSRGDVVLMEDDTLLEVIDQNPDTVVLKYRGGQLMSVPTTEFYAKEMTNLSRGGTFGVNSTFGIDYQHQAISLTSVPKILRDAIRESLSHSDLNDFIKDIRVELKEANSSSIDYWIFVTCDSRGAKSYLRIRRSIQSACIEACTRESLNIPFPHVAVVRKSQ